MTRGTTLRSQTAILATLCGLPCLAATLPHSGDNGASLEEITRRLVQSEERKKSDVQDFTVTRRYTLHNSHLAADASLVVRVRYEKGRGKSFEVLRSENADGLSRRVLERVLEGEVQSTHEGRVDDGALTPNHYDFELLGSDTFEGTRCYVLGLHPKFKSRYLLTGKAWIAGEDFAVIKIEGRPSASFSFWVGKPEITQEFRKYGDFWMASYNRSLSDSHFLGKSELTVEFSDYDVHGAPKVARIMGVTPRAHVASHQSLCR